LLRKFRIHLSRDQGYRSPTQPPDPRSVEPNQGSKLRLVHRRESEALGAYNAPFLRNPPYSYFGIFIRDEANAIRAGLIGNCYAGWLFVALLWVHADLRRIGIGSRLMAEAERHGRDFGCHSAFVDTFTFQGPEFYPKLGYREYAQLDYPPDHQRIFFRKKLTGRPSCTRLRTSPISIVNPPSPDSETACRPGKAA
jgi:GNAT superfamily N-acetyltransferase